MSKNKFIKTLLIAGLSVVSAAALAGAVACKEKHEHKYAETYSYDKENHWYECLNEGHTGEYEKLPHKDENKDNKCDDCGCIYYWNWAPIVVDTTELPGEGGVIDETLGESVVVLGSATDSDYSIKDKKRKIIYGGDTKEYTQGLKLNGKALTGKKSLKVNLPADATILVYATSDSSTTDASLLMLDKDGKAVKDTEQSVSFNAVTHEKGKSSTWGYAAAFNVNAKTTYYIGGADSSVVLFRVAVIFGNFEEDKGELVPAKAATCEADGNDAYYFSNYGRYFDENGKHTGPTVLKTKTGHEYQQDGDPTLLPTESAAGKVNIKCKNDESHTKEISLPALKTAGAYTRMPAGEEGKTQYIYADEANNVGIMFVAATVAEEKEEALTKYVVDFSDLTKFSSDGKAVTFLADKAAKNAEIKYVDGKKTGLTAMGEKNDGKAISVKTQEAGNTKSAALTFGGTAAIDKNSVSFKIPVKGTVTIKVSYFSSNADRYIVVLDKDKKKLATTDNAVAGKVVTDGATAAKNPSSTTDNSSDGVIKNATITLSVEKDTMLYLGSATSGIWVTSLDIQWVAAQ